MPFSHDIAGGNGKLIVDALQSPNYDEEAGTGWQVTRSGAATFFSISLPNTPGTKVTFSSTKPPDPHTGDLWYDTGNGLLLSQWDGTEWAPHLVGTGAIAGGAVTSALIALGAVAAANIADGTITSQQISDAAGILGTQLDANAGITGAQVADLTLTVNKFNSPQHEIY